MLLIQTSDVRLVAKDQHLNVASGHRSKGTPQRQADQPPPQGRARLRKHDSFGHDARESWDTDEQPVQCVALRYSLWSDDGFPATSPAEYPAPCSLRARGGLEDLVTGDFAELPFDDDWLVGMTLLAETATALGDAEAAGPIYRRLLPYDERVAIAIAGVSTGAVSATSGFWQRPAAPRRRRAPLRAGARPGADRRPTLVATLSGTTPGCLYAIGPATKSSTRPLATAAVTAA